MYIYIVVSTYNEIMVLQIKYEVCMYQCMHACMHAWMDGWMDGWMDVLNE